LMSNVTKTPARGRVTDDPVTESYSDPATIHSDIGGQPHLHNLRDQFEGEESTGRASWNSIKWALRQLKPRANDLPTVDPSTFVLKHYFEDMRRHLKGNLGEINLGLFLGLGLLAIHITFMALSIVSGLVVSDFVALSKSPQCRLLLANTTGSTAEITSRRSKYFLDLETESAEYAKRCYPANARAEECSYFYVQSIHFSVKHNDNCYGQL
jgi:hypothetical protein